MVVGYGPNEADDEEREVCGSVRVGGRNPKSMWLNDEIKATVRRKEAACDEEIKGRCMEAYR